MLEGNYPSLQKQEDMIYLSILQEYKFNTMSEAIKNIIKREKFPPNIAKILEEYERVEASKVLIVIKAMNDAGLFYHPTEYDKAMRWAQKGFLPEWFKQMMRDFLNNKNNKLENKGNYLKG